MNKNSQDEKKACECCHNYNDYGPQANVVVVLVRSGPVPWRNYGENGMWLCTSCRDYGCDKWAQQCN
jgi:hypothetical protein